MWRFVEPLAPSWRRRPALADVGEFSQAERALRRKTHQTVAKLTDDLYPRVHLNTAISGLMELVNELYAFGDASGLFKPGRRAATEPDAPPVVPDVPASTLAAAREAVEALVRLLSPFAPHMAEELWEMLGHTDGIVAAGWPGSDAGGGPRRSHRDAGAGQRQGPRARDRARRIERRRRAGRRAGRPEREGAHGGQDHRQGDRRGRAPRERGGQVTVSLRRRAFLSAVVAASGVAASGCGYNLAGRGNFLPSYIRVIGIPVFANNTSVFDIDQLFTQRVRTEFVGRGRYQVLPLSEGADAILLGTVTGLSLEPSGFNENNQATRYIVRVQLKLEFRDVKANKVIWENPSLEILDEYDLTTATGGLDASAFLGQNRAAADRMADVVARRTVSSILEAF